MAINTTMLDELENTKTQTAVNPQDYLIQSQPVQIAEPPIKKSRGINVALLDSIERGDHAEVIENKAKVIQPDLNLVTALQKKPEQPKPSILETGTPEPPEQITAQFDDILNPKTGKDTMFVGANTVNPIASKPLPKNIFKVDSPAGTLYTTNKAKADEYSADFLDETRAKVLGYNETKKDVLNSGKEPQAVIVKDVDGYRIHEELTTDPNSVIEKYQKQGYKNINVESPMQTQIRRAAANVVKPDYQTKPAGTHTETAEIAVNAEPSMILNAAKKVVDVGHKYLPTGDGWKTIARAAKIAKDQPYKEGEIHDRISNMMTRAFSPVAYLIPGISHKDLIAELDKEAEGFSGFGGAIVPAAGSIGEQAAELFAFQKAFGVVGGGAKLLGKIPAVGKVANAINKMGGVRQFSEKFPHIFQATKSALKEFAVGDIVGQGFGYIRGKDEGLSGMELFKEMQKEGAIAGLYSGAFSIAGSRDRYNYVKSLRTEMTKRFDIQLQEQVAKLPKGKYVNVGTPEEPKMLFKKGVSPRELEEFRRSGLKYIDDTVAAVDSDLIDFAKGNLYPNIRDKVVNISPAKAAERFMKYGFERPQLGKPESQSRPSPTKAPESLKTGMGARDELKIDQPLTRTGEILQAVSRPVETAKGIIKDIRTEMRLPIKPIRNQPPAPPSGQTAMPPIVTAKQEQVAANAKPEAVIDLSKLPEGTKLETQKFPAKVKVEGSPFSMDEAASEHDVITLSKEPTREQSDYLRGIGWQPYSRETKRWFSPYREQTPEKIIATPPADARTQGEAVVDTGQKRPYEMTKQEFIDSHENQFIRQAGKKVIAGVKSTDGKTIYPLPASFQKNGKLLKPISEILDYIYDTQIVPSSKFISQLKSTSATIPPMAEKQAARDNIAPQNTAEAGKVVRFEAGKKLTSEQKQVVLKSISDSYKDLKAPKVSKGFSKYSGDEISGYAYDPEYMHTSDITGRKIRHYIKLPDGKIAHPTELYPNLKQSEIDKHIIEAKNAEKQIQARKEELLSVATKAKTIEESNIVAGQRGLNKSPDYKNSIVLQKDENFIRVISENDVNILKEQGFIEIIRAGKELPAQSSFSQPAPNEGGGVKTPQKPKFETLVLAESTSQEYLNWLKKQYAGSTGKYRQKIAKELKSYKSKHNSAIQQDAALNRVLPDKVIDEYRKEKWMQDYLIRNNEMVLPENKKSPTKQQYTSIPAEWHNVDLMDWGKKGLRRKGDGKGKKNIFPDDPQNLAKLLSRTPRATMKRVKELAGGEFWSVSSMKNPTYYLTPKRVVEQVKAELGEAAFERTPKAERSPKQKINDLILQAKAHKDLDGWQIGRRIRETANAFGIAENDLTETQKKYIKEYDEALKDPDISESIRAEMEREIPTAAETELDPDNLTDEQWLEAQTEQQIADHIDGAFDDFGEADKDLLGETLPPPPEKTASGEQQEFLKKEDYKTLQEGDRVESARLDVAGQMKLPETPKAKPSKQIVDDIVNFTESFVDPGAEEYITADMVNQKAVDYWNTVKDKTNSLLAKEDTDEDAASEVWDIYYKLRELTGAKGSVRDNVIYSPKEQIKDQLQKHFKNVSEEQIDAVLAIWEANAEVQGITLDEWVDKYIADVKSGKTTLRKDALLQQEEDKNLVVLHNIKPQNVLHAQKMGGLAVPSLAISHIDTPLEGFGEITLVAKPSLIDPRASKKNKVFAADAYTPKNITDIMDFLNYLRNMPTEYFEVKMQRVVGLNEFYGAIIPKGSSESVIKILKDNGLQIEYYDKSSKNEGDRKIALKKLAESQSGILFQDKKAAVEFLADGRAVLHAFESADISSLVHETAHIFRRTLSGEDLKIAALWSGTKNQEKWDNAAEERFARAFERYLRDGKAPKPKLQAIFDKFKNWLMSIYKSITGKSPLNIKITPEIKGVFNRLLVKETQSENKKATIDKESKSDILFQTVSDEEKSRRKKIRESAFAKRTRADIKESGVTDKPAAVTYEVMSHEEQEVAAENFVKKNYQRGVRIALMEEVSPQGIEVAKIWDAVIKAANEKKDFDTLRKLVASEKLSLYLTGLGQTISMAKFDPYNPVIAGKEIQKIREEKAQYRKIDSEAAKAKVKELEEKLAAKQKEFDDYQKQVERKLAEQKINELIKDNAKKKPATKHKPRTREFGSRNKIFTKSAAEAARVDLRKMFSGGTFSSGIDPSALVKLTQYGGYLFEGGIREIGAWSKAMMNDIGVKAEPYLKDVWSKARTQFYDVERTNITDKMFNRLENNSELSGMSGLVRQLAKSFVESGVSTRDELVDKVHDVLKNIIPDITRRETMDAISGYGKYSQLTKGEIDIKLRDLRGQLQQIGKLEDLQNKKPPLKTGVERRTPSDEERRLIKLVDEAKRRYGIAVTNSETQLKSSLQSLKTRLTHEIEDIKNMFETGNFAKKPHIPIQLDQEGMALRAKIEPLRKQLKIARELSPTITEQELEKMTELSNVISEKKIIVDESERREQDSVVATPEEMDWGLAIADFEDYVQQLKADSQRRKWADIKAHPFKSVLSGFGSIPAIARTLRSTLDNSWHFIQGLPVAYVSDMKDIATLAPRKMFGMGHKGNRYIWSKTFANSFKVMWDTFRGRNVSRVLRATIVSDPDYDRIKTAKVATGAIEEEFPEQLGFLEKIPVLGKIHLASSNAFTQSAHYMRYRVAKMFFAVARNTGADLTSKESLESIGMITNSLTARGHSKNGGQSKPGVMNAIMWAPRKLWGNIDVLTLHARDSKLSGFARKQAAINLLSIILGVAFIKAIAWMFTDEDYEYDPRSTDFRGIKIGNTHIPVDGGTFAILVLASRLVPIVAGKGYTKNSSTGKLTKINSDKYGSMTGEDVLINFFKNKTAPAATAVLNILRGKDFDRKPTTPLTEAIRMVTPISVENYIDAAEFKNKPDQLLQIITSAMSVQANTYSDFGKLTESEIIAEIQKSLYKEKGRERIKIGVNAIGKDIYRKGRKYRKGDVHFDDIDKVNELRKELAKRRNNK